MPDVRNLIILLGDQLGFDNPVLDGFDPQQDCLWMAENQQEATHVWSHKSRLVLFFSAMRHFRQAIEQRGWPLEYHALTADGRRDSGRDFAAVLASGIRRLKPESLTVLQPGDWRVQRQLQQCAKDLNLTLHIVPDGHFYCGLDEFEDWAQGRKRLVLEDFYREMRKQHGVLLRYGEPEGGQWNLDKSNRDAFGKQGPGNIPAPARFSPDETTQTVIRLVEARYTEHPGSTASFDWPVTREQALQALDSFINERLPEFGRWQDAIWSGEHLLYHSQLSAALNLHLLTPRECVQAAVKAYESGTAPLNSVEGFVRQILGWREFVRGFYWHFMPDYQDKNALSAQLPVPAFYWHGDTDMACVADAISGLIQHAYAHHIIRLMVLGLFALLAGVHPRKFHEWHMAMYADAIDWVSLPNALGMSQYADAGLLGTKPYSASGNYINKMSNHCKGCRYNYREAAGENACPFTTLYWDFLDRHSERLGKNRRMNFQMRNLDKKRADDDLMQAIRERAAKLKSAIQQDKQFPD